MSDLVPRSEGGFWVAWRRGSISVRTSSFNAIPSDDIWSAWVRRCAVHCWIHASVLASLPSSRVGEELCHVHFSPQGQLILTSVNGLLVLYFPVIFLIPLMPCLKISFFRPISLLSSRLFCFRFSFTSRLSALPISALRRTFHLSCCLTSFWKVGRRCKNPSPCRAFLVAPLIL